MLHPFSISHPDCVPWADSISKSLTNQLGGAITQLLSLADEWASARVSTTQLQSVLESFDQSFEKASAHISNRDDDSHDEYFHVVRVGGDSSIIFVRMILQAQTTLLQDLSETPFSIPSHKLAMLEASFGSLLCWALSREIDVEPARIGWTAPLKAVEEDASMNRWIRGHQIFAAITQGLIAIFRDLKQALSDKDTARTRTAGELAALLLQGSGAALEFTGDFSSDDYNDLIRPSMTPPLVPETFSGLLSSDHRYLVHLLREMKPLLDGLKRQDAELHASIADALRAVYDSHKFVCNRLVGKMPSLMMAAGSHKSGAEQIEKFKTLRMKVFQLPSETARGASDPHHSTLHPSTPNTSKQ